MQRKACQVCYPMIYQLVRPFLFRLEPEVAHHLALSMARWIARHYRLATVIRKVISRPRTLPTRVCGINFPNPIGLAAGFDKNAEALWAWWALGFGFAELGTVTPQPQAGQAQPRLFRLPRLQALVNRMGFNNEGAERIAQRLATSAGNYSPPMPVGISLGKNAITPLENAAEDYAQAAERLAPYADFLVVNVSSPNTSGLRGLQTPTHLRTVLHAIRNASNTKPIFVKLAPELDGPDLQAIADACLDAQASGFIVTNTLSTEGRPDLPIGGLSGRPLHAMALKRVETLRQHFGEGIALIGCGGIMDVSTLEAFFDAGANLVQLYTGLIYKGPFLPGRLSRAICQNKSLQCRIHKPHESRLNP